MRSLLILAALAILAAAVPARARVGETVAEVTRRLGKPASEERTKDGTVIRVVHSKGQMQVITLFLNGISVREEYAPVTDLQATEIRNLHSQAWKFQGQQPPFRFYKTSELSSTVKGDKESDKLTLTISDAKQDVEGASKKLEAELKAKNGDAENK